MAEPTPPTSELGAVRDAWLQGRGTALLGGVGAAPDLTDADPAPAWRWPARVDTIDAMRRDAQVMTLENVTILPIRRWRWYVDPNGARDEVAEHVARDLGLPLLGGDEVPTDRRRGRFRFDDHLRLALRAPSYGAAWFEQVAEHRESDGLVHLRKLAPRPLRTIARVNVARDGGLESIEQGVAFGGGAQGRSGTSAGNVTIPVDRLVAYVWDQEPGSWSGNSMLRALYRHYWLKDKLYRVDAMKHERFGAPMVVFEAPENATPAQLEALDIMAQAVRSGASAGGAVPMGTRSHLIGASGSGSDVVSSIVMHDEAMARAWSAMVVQLAQGGEGGNRALGGTFADLLHALQLTIASDFRDTFNPHVVEDLVDWNYGPDEPSPQVVFEEGDVDLATGDLVLAVNAGLVTVDPDTEAWFRTKYRLPDRVIGEDVPVPSAPGVVVPAEAVEAVESVFASAEPERRGLLARMLERVTRRHHAADEPEADPMLPDRPMRRQRSAVEVKAETNFRDLDERWQSAVDEALEEWSSVQAAQRDALLAAIIEADGDLVALAGLTAPVLGVEVVETAIRRGIADGIETAAAEQSAQGVTAPRPTVDEVLPDIDARAEAMAITLARSYGEAAGRHAQYAVGVGSTPEDTAAIVADKLDALTDAFLRDQLGAAVQGGQNAGRLATMGKADVEPTYVASEILDGNTCDPCRNVDQTEFADRDEAEAAYPLLGAYHACQGGPRCRGTVVAVYDEAPTSR